MSTTPTLRDAAPQVADLLIRITNCAKHWAYMAEIDNGDAAKAEAHRHGELLAELVAALTQGAGEALVDKSQDLQGPLVDKTANLQGLAGAAEPVYWEFRWKDTHPQTVTSGQWYPWEKVVPRNGHLDTVESRLSELRGYIAQGKCYELRALYPAPPAQQLQQAVARAVEECAAICEGIEDEYQRREGHKYPELKSDAQTGAGDCAAAIRAKGTHQ